MNAWPSISIVIIARNEAKNIARAIESVLRAVEHWPQAGILLVDSASTDETVEIASQYPITIVRLDPSWFLSASAGRHIGMHYTRADLMAYLDGDMELAPAWLDRAVPFLLEHPEAAGVDGYFRNVYIRDGQIIHEQDVRRNPPGTISEVTFFGGAAVYWRSALESVGGFNPYLVSLEEPELCMRLRYAGYKLFRLPYCMCKHYGPPFRSWQDSIRRFRKNLWVGYGQVPRYHLRTGLLWTALREWDAYSVIFLAGILIFIIIVLFAFVLQNGWLLVAWVLVLSAVLVTFWIKKRSLREALLSLVVQGLVAYSAVRGFLMSPRSPVDYPTDVEVIRVCDCRGDLA
jgi:glycosyltransferase involved in cell wall biosynthesis